MNTKFFKIFTLISSAIITVYPLFAGLKYCYFDNEALRQFLRNTVGDNEAFMFAMLGTTFAAAIVIALCIISALKTKNKFFVPLAASVALSDTLIFGYLAVDYNAAAILPFAVYGFIAFTIVWDILKERKKSIS